MFKPLIISLILITILSVTQTSACIVSAPNFVYINRISPSTDPDTLILNVQRTFLEEESNLYLSISSHLIFQDIPTNVEPINLTYDGYQMQVMTVTENSSGVFINYVENEGEGPVSFSFNVTMYNIDSESMILGLIYEKLDTIYIREGTWGYETLQLIGSLSNNTIINNGTDLFPPNLMLIRPDITIAIGSSPDKEAICDGPSFYKITDEGFDLITSTVLGGYNLINPISENLHVVTYDLEIKLSKIQSYNIESGSSSVFAITAQELEDLLFDNNSTDLISLNFLYLFEAIVFVMFIKRTKR